jgi:hypothetical protein
MKRTLLTLAAAITASAASISLSVANLPHPTEMQKQLGNTANTVAIAGATAIFGMLDDEDKAEQKRDRDQDSEDEDA